MGNVLEVELLFLGPVEGRIMNRFTKDMATIDDMLPLVLFDLIQVGLGPIHIHILYWCYTNLYTSYNNPALDLLKYELNRPPHGQQ